MRLTYLTLLLAILSGCNNRVFISRTGKPFKLTNLAGDRGGFYYDSKQQDTILPFNRSRFQNSEEGNYVIQYVTSKDIKALQEQFPKLIVMPWNPGCPGDNGKVHALRKLDSLNVPTLLVSLSYNFDHVKYRYRQGGLASKNIYLYHAATKAGEELVVKHIRLVKKLCPSCYDSLKDEAMDVDALVFESGKARMVLNSDSLKLLY